MQGLPPRFPGSTVIRFLWLMAVLERQFWFLSTRFSLATDADGNQGQHVFSYAVTGNMKVGDFSFTVVDLDIPVSGIPIRITRTYVNTSE